MVGMKNKRLSLEQPQAPSALQRLPAALEILSTRLRAALEERRAAAPGSERQRRADEEVAYLNDLYVGLQRRMAIPAEIWHLEGGRKAAHGRVAVPPLR